MGKLIVIEGLDGSGKSTQLEMLFRKLSDSGKKCREVSFPNYNSKACEPVKMYLGAEFGNSPDSVNAYAASALYAVDRFASYKTDWGKAYLGDEIIVCGRYVTSNLIHQCSKLDKPLWTDFADWLYDFEYSKMGLPKPDCVLFLNMPVEFSDKLLKSRYNGDNSKRDIHEKDLNYQLKCREAATFAAAHGGWKVIDCVKDNELRDIDDISEEIFKTVSKIL